MSASGVGQTSRLLTHSNVTQNGHAASCVAQVERVVELGHLIAPHLSNLGHFREFLWVAGEEVKEGQAVKVLGPLVGDLDDLGGRLALEGGEK